MRIQTTLAAAVAAIAATCAPKGAEAHLRQLAACSTGCETVSREWRRKRVDPARSATCHDTDLALPTLQEFQNCHNFQKSNRNKTGKEAYTQCISEINNSQGPIATHW